MEKGVNILFEGLTKYAKKVEKPEALNQSCVKLQNMVGLRLKPPLTHDTIELSPDIDVSMIAGIKLKPNVTHETPIILGPSKNHRELFAQKHANVTKKYLLNPKGLSREKVSVSRYEVIDGIQHMENDYVRFNKNAHLNKKLDDIDKKYYNNVLKEMDKLQENTYVLRYLEAYKDLEREIKEGVLKLRGLTSCTTENGEFLIDWGCEMKQPYLLKINLKSGQKVLNCNFYHCGESSRLGSEVVLPEGRGIIKKIDKEFNYIEVDFVPNEKL